MSKTISLSRQQLYDEIWQVSVAGVARKYNLNYQKLIAKCKEADIPFPSSGYWTKKSLGKDVAAEVVVLPPSEIEHVELLLAGAKVEKKKKLEEKQPTEELVEKDVAEESTGDAEEKLNQADEVVVNDTVLMFLDSEEKKRVLRVASELRVRDKKRLHEQLGNYRNLIVEWKRKE